jgi:uncharacterized protein YjdB
MTTNDDGYDVVCKMNIYNNTIYHNGYYKDRSGYIYGIYVENTSGSNDDELARIFKNNISYANEYGAVYALNGALYTHAYNSWDNPPGVTMTDADFISVDSTGLSGPRQTDGSLPVTNFLRLARGSDLIDAGTNVGFPFSGSAPDLGAFEYSSSDQLKKPVTGIIVTGKDGFNTITVNHGTLQLFANITPVDATDKTVTWTIISGSDKASINSSGLVSAFANGIITAKATANDGSGIYGTLAIAISNQLIPVSSIILSSQGGVSFITSIGGTLQIIATLLPANATNQSLSWSVSDGKDKALVNTNGLVTALSYGSAVVRADANDGSGIYGLFTITISNQFIPVTSIIVSGAGGITSINTDNGTLQLTALALPSNASNKTVTWSISSGAEFASVGSTGLLKAVKNGTVIIKATANDGSNVSGNLTVNITNQIIPIEKITLIGRGGDNTIPEINGTLQLGAEIQPADATNKTLIWSIIKGTGEATITSSGIVTAVMSGTVTAKATASDGSGISGTILIYINAPPVIILNYEPKSYSGFVYEIDASGSYDENKDNLTYSWETPYGVPVSTLNGSSIRYLSPVVNSSEKLAFAVSVSDGKTIRTKSIITELVPYKPELEEAEISDIEARTFQAPYYPYNVIDGNIGTMWAANGDNQWLILKFRESYKVEFLELAFNPGNINGAYFDVSGSTDNIAWEPVLIKSSSCAFSNDRQVFDFPPAKAVREYNNIKITGRGNNFDTWNYISELKIYGYRHKNVPFYESLPVHIFPNPASESITIKLTGSIPEFDYLHIISLSGKIIYTFKIEHGSPEFTIPVSFKDGVYLVEMGNGNGTLFTQKLIVKR